MSLLMMATKDGGIPILPDQRPAPLDQIISEMRPTGRRIATLHVASDGSQLYTSLRVAAIAAGVIQSQRMADEGQTIKTPNYRVDIIVHPGDYVSSVVLPSFVGIYGYGSGLVNIIQDPPNPELGTVTPNGNTYIEGVRIIKNWQNTDTVPLPKYPIHNVNSGTSILADVILDNQLGGTAYGSDGADRGYTVLYRCGLIGNVNAHGWDTTLLGQQIAFVKCNANSSVGWVANNNTAPDECWVVGGSVGGITVTGTATKLHRDPATVVTGTVSASGSQDTNTNWPIPKGGLSVYDRGYYGM